MEIDLHGGPAVATAAMRLLSELGAEAIGAPAAAPECFEPAHPELANAAIGREMLDALGSARSPLAVAALTQQWSAGLSRLARLGLEQCTAGTADPQPLARQLRAAADRLGQMQRLLDPAEVVLAGPPNVGKSTLANAMVGREVSIVHHAAGTTRDWVRELAVVRGVPVYRTATAGLWDVADAVDAEAVRRARQRIARADLVLLLGAGAAAPVPDWLTARPHRLLCIASKCDACPAFADAAAVSAFTGDGLADLGDRIVAALGLADFDPTAPAAFTHRQADLLARAAQATGEGRDQAVLAALTELLEAAQPSMPAPQGG